jgi:hypothetical protein
MSEPRNLAGSHGGVHHYTMLCAAALGMMTLALYLRGSDMVSMLFPPMVGLTAMAFRWRTGAIGVLFFLFWFIASQHSPWLHPLFIAQDIWWIVSDRGFGGASGRYVWPALGSVREGFGLTELVLCASTLAYVAAHYRLLSVTRSIFPTDPRRRTDRLSAYDRRSRQLVDGREVLTLLAPIPLWIAFAWLCWQWLQRRDYPEIGRWWQVMALAWLFGMLFLVAAAIVRYVSSWRMRPEEAALFLQDTLWRETSREQRRITRWVAWARRRRQRKDEP